MAARRLTSEEIHLLKLIQKDANNNGWAKVSARVLPLVQALPTQLVNFGTPKTISKQYVRLTRTGRNIVDALNWL